MIEFRTGLRVMVIAVWVLLGGAGPAEEPRSATTAPATEIRPTVVIEGQVIDAMGAGIQAVKVVAKLKKKGVGEGEPEYINTATTDEMGDFKIMGAPSLRGTAIVTMTKRGFKDFAGQVELVPGELPPFIDAELEGAVVLFGVVCDARTGSGIGGAMIKVEAKFRGWSATSETDGKFRVPGLAPGPGVVTVDAKGYGRSRNRVQRFEDFGELIVLMKPERIVHIRTVDETGNPVAGVHVECFSDEPNDFRSEMSDDEGRVVLRGVNRDTKKFLVRLWREGYVASVGYDRETVLPEDKPESHHTLRLSPAGSIRGTVTDAATGALLNGARVVAGEGPADGLPRAFADFEGAYRVDGIAPGETPVTVHLAGYAPELAIVTITPGKEVQEDFKLAAGQTVAGVVVDDGGKPVANAHVYATRWRGHETLALQAVTDPQGRFTIHSAPADEFEIAIRHPGHVPIDGVTVQGGKTDYCFELQRRGGPRPSSKIKVGQPAPPLALVTLDGKRLKLADLNGKWVLLDFWATWCLPCLAEIPNLKEVHAAFGRRDDFVMISISLDSDKKAVQKLIRDQSLDWFHVFGEEGGVPRAAKDYGADAIPLLVLINPDGKIVAIDLQGPGMREAIGRLLQAPPPA